MNKVYNYNDLFQKLKFSVNALNHKEYFPAFFRMVPHLVLRLGKSLH